MLTYKELKENFEKKVQNVYNARIIGVYNNKLTFEILDSFIKCRVYVNDACVLRINDLNSVFRIGDIYPISIFKIEPIDCDGDYTTYKIFASLKPTWGTLNDVENYLSVGRYLPVLDSDIVSNKVVACSPNFISLIEYSRIISGKKTILAQLKCITETKKIKLHISNDENLEDDSECLRNLFLDYKRDFSDMPAYIDVEEFNKSLKITKSKAIAEKKNGVENDEIVKLNTTNTILLPSKNIEFVNKYLLINTVQRINENNNFKEVFKKVNVLFKGWFCATQLNKISDEYIDDSLLGCMVKSKLLNQKILKSNCVRYKVYCPGENYKFLFENHNIMPEHIYTNATLYDILKSLNVNEFVINMYVDNPSIINEIQRYKMFSADFTDKSCVRFRANAFLKDKKVIIESVKEIEDLEFICEKIKRIDTVLKQCNEECSVYVISLNSEIEDKLLECIHGDKFTNVRLFTTTEGEFKNSFIVREFKPVVSKQKIGYLKLFSLSAILK